jgi:hypothetical protein
MASADILLPLLIAGISGFIIGYLVFRSRVAATEARYRADLAARKAGAEEDIRKDTSNRSRSTLRRKIAGQMAPLLAGVLLQPDRCPLHRLPR